MYLHLKTGITFKHLFLCEALISLEPFIHNMEEERLYLIEKKNGPAGWIAKGEITPFFLAPA